MAAGRAESGSWEELSLPTELKLSAGPSSGVEQAKNESGNGQKENSSEQHSKTKESTSKKLCGFLEKQGEKGLIKTWKRRWFVFQARRCRLYYYRNPDDPSELGYIDINDATFAMNISSGRMDQFDIRIANRVYHLQAQDQQTALYWLQELQAQRREYSRKITAMCHHSEVDVVPEPSESPGLITAVVPHKIQEEDDTIFEAIPAPETVGENAARRPQDGRSGISIKHMKTEIKNFASKRQSVIVTPTQVLPDTVPRSSSMSEDASTKRSIIARKMFSTRSSSTTTDRAFPECPQCRKLGLQLEACTAKLEETEEYAQAREEAIVSLNQYIREFVLDKSLRDNLQSEELKDDDDKDKYIKQLERKLRIQGKELSNCKKEIAMLKEVISSKDEVVIKTTNELATVYGAEESTKKSRKSSESNLSQPNEKIVPFSNLGSSGETFRSFLTHIENLETDKEKVGKLKEALRAYIAQNSFLNSEVVELNKLRKDDTERIRTYIVKNQTQEADLCRIKSKFYLLVQEVHAPVKDGQFSLPQEVISQLLEEAIEIESQSKKTEEGSQTPFDRYGFYTKLERGDEDALAAVAGKLNRRSDEIVKASTNGDVRQTSVEVKWENYMMTNRNKEFQKTPELKNLIRSGIPHDFRAKIWLSCVNSYVKATKRVSGSGYYERLLASKKDCFSPAVKQIGLDLLRTLPNNKFYDKQGADGIDQLRRVLLAFSWHNQDIGYCQGLNRLAAIALLYLSEEDSFWALVALVEFVMPKDYYSKTLITSQSDQRVLKDILAEKIPKVSEHLDKLNIDLSLVTFNWFLTAFVDSVPIEIVLRIWDTLLYEGTKVLFRFAVAIFRVNEAKILEITDNMKMFTFLRNMPSKLTNDDKLFQVAFQGLNPFPMQKITSLREFHHSALKVELAELDKLRREYVETKNEKSNVVVSDGET